jgi:hypothetical protein
MFRGTDDRRGRRMLEVVGTVWPGLLPFVVFRSCGIGLQEALDPRMDVLYDSRRAPPQSFV